ncbi:UDP-N-acetylmuramoyl-L-alanine--D-glutamate ligase [Candidatus Finniella inopinata]|uniref:UDP-N-acetylmuramoylalanine--D-glutamate ligase n=1 Tax=Candidatus Finniella inopinata TaxID=1696036 RepID=A0A4Q7DIW7_9PROT|nr:UDP-N-acetylmuramoyl-L-alanine--D-glutamate ligase [Candidatus Finniella inopinata]RZI45954.1 UDP-N-acetylmuramoyl-L-alanine--D-glutamate ligase [Candidatus Finniella inopinata]
MKTYLILGMGKSGQAAAEWLSRQDAKVLTFDDHGPCSLDPNNIPWDQITAVIQSPGVPFSYPSPHPLTALGMAKNIPILTDINLLQQANPKAQFVGITGTNGKSTTTALIGHVLNHSQRACAVGGNIGVPALSLPSLDENGTYVLELSSFQLEVSTPLTLEVAAWLNITPDHLDRHGTIEAYVAAKEKIFLSARHAVVNIDDTYSLEVYKRLKEKGMDVVGVSCVQKSDIHVDQGVLYDNYKPVFDLRPFETLQGLHNYQNAATAYAVCKLFNISVDQIAEAFKTFAGLAHRQEIVGHFKNITFVNDSKATNADAAVHAFNRYADQAVYWIAGGKAKSGGIHSLKDFFPTIRHAFLIGEAQSDFAATLYDHTPCTLSGNLDKALTDAIDIISKEAPDEPAIVLLSPACASFDQFQSFEHRGDTFRHLVAKMLESYT